MREKAVWLSLIAVLFLSSLVYADVSDFTHINIQVTDSSGNVVTEQQNHIFGVNISTSADCTNVIYRDSQNLTTDARGIVSFYLPNISNVNFNQQTYFCEYIDGVLKYSNYTGSVPSSIYAQNATNANQLDYINASQYALIGSCPSGFLVQNTTHSGVECLPIYYFTNPSNYWNASSNITYFYGHEGSGTITITPNDFTVAGATGELRLDYQNGMRFSSDGYFRINSNGETYFYSDHQDIDISAGLLDEGRLLLNGAGGVIISSASTDINVSNNLNVIGNARAIYFIGDGSQITNISSSFNNTNYALTNKSNNFVGNINISQNITASRFCFGNGTCLNSGGSNFNDTYLAKLNDSNWFKGETNLFQNNVSISGNTVLTGGLSVGGHASSGDALEVHGAGTANENLFEVYNGTPSISTRKLLIQTDTTNYPPGGSGGTKWYIFNPYFIDYGTWSGQGTPDRIQTIFYGGTGAFIPRLTIPGGSNGILELNFTKNNVKIYDGNLTLDIASSYNNFAVCYTTGGTFGHCTSAVNASGGCTCVAN